MSLPRDDAPDDRTAPRLREGWRTGFSLAILFWLAVIAIILLVGPHRARAETRDIGPLAQATVRAVQARLTYELEPDGPRKWRIEPADGRGDCVAFALTIAHRLVAAGVAPSRLRFVVLDGYARGQTHAVILIDGATVADPQSPWLAPLAAYAGRRIAHAYPIQTAFAAAASPTPWAVLAFAGD